MSSEATLEANKALVCRIWEEIFNRRNFALAGEVVAPESVNHEAPPGLTAEGPEAVRQVVTMLTSAFPDNPIDILDMVAEGDKVVTRNTFSGTHQGPYMRIPPNGQALYNGAAQHHPCGQWQGRGALGVRDDLGMLQQLGVIPIPAR